jgi:2',3'-cyclic-nucleotide 2'-phosphodiesterase (5'-nucleotidase family)
MKCLCTVKILCLSCLFLVLTWPLEGASLRLLYFNDFHGFSEPHSSFGATAPHGGVAWLAARAADLRREKPSLLLVAGDALQGNNWANLSQGRSCIELLNLMGVDALVVGNHEFDFGLRVLEQRIGEAHFPVLGANVEGLGDLHPYVIREVNGVRVAVLGVVTTDTPVTTHPRNVAGLTFHSPEETVSRYLPELRQQAAVVVILSHLGYSADRDLAARVAGIDVIVGGHSHTRLDLPALVNGTLIVQAGEHAEDLGVLDLDVEEGRIVASKGWLVDIAPGNWAADARVLALVEKYRDQADEVLQGRAGETGVALDGEHVRRRETNLGDLVADIVRETAAADAAIVNGGGIRAGIPAGVIRVKDVYNALPFDNYIVSVRLTGSAIRQTLEHGVSGIETGSGAFPQVSGLVFSFDPQAPPGSRVREVSIGGHPLDPDREYSVATNDFLAAGGDGYTAFGDAVRSSPDFALVGGSMKGEKLLYNDSGRWLRDLVIQWLREKGTIRPVVEQRIREVVP